MVCTRQQAVRGYPPENTGYPVVMLQTISKVLAQRLVTAKESLTARCLVVEVEQDATMRRHSGGILPDGGVLIEEVVGVDQDDVMIFRTHPSTYARFQRVISRFQVQDAARKFG